MREILKSQCVKVNESCDLLDREENIGGGAWRLVRLEPHLNLMRGGLDSPKL